MKKCKPIDSKTADAFLKLGKGKKIPQDEVENFCEMNCTRYAGVRKQGDTPGDQEPYCCKHKRFFGKYPHDELCACAEHLDEVIEALDTVEDPGPMPETFDYFAACMNAVKAALGVK